MSPPESLVQLLKPWNEFYSHSKTTETIVLFFHIGALLLAGGLAIAADRGSLRALRTTVAERTVHMRELAAVHRWVITGLTVMVLSGLALLMSDIETFWGSWIYWTKMAFVVLLLVNGLMMTRVEAALARDATDTSPHWAKLHRTAVSSLALWFIITALGVALANFS
jgi:cytochrome b subunit of formate dehydrogenase